MLIYYSEYTAGGEERSMADVLDKDRGAWLVRTRCTDEIDGEEYEMTRCFVFEDEESCGCSIMSITEYIYRDYSEEWPEEIVYMRRIDPGEELYVDIMIDHRPNYLPALREAI